jgi:predicted phage terminase large subunit-like protein
VVREEGDILCPEREGAPELEAAKRRLGTFAFNSQYQQAPSAREGNLIKIEWLNATYRTIPQRFDSVVMALDTAFKTGTVNDFSAAVTVGSLNAARDGHPPAYYLLDAWHGKLEFADLKRQVVELYQTWRPHAVLIEDAASGQSLIQELRSGTSLPLRPVKVDRDKFSRVAAATPTLEARRLLLPESAWWREPFIEELTCFPNGAHDDWVDAISHALLFLKSHSSWREQFEIIKQLYSPASEKPPFDSSVAAQLAGAPGTLVRRFQRQTQPNKAVDPEDE